MHKILPASTEKPNQKEIGLANLSSTNGSCYCRMSQSPESERVDYLLRDTDWFCVCRRIHLLLSSCWALHITILPPSTSLSQIHTHLCRWQALTPLADYPQSSSPMLLSSSHSHCLLHLHTSLPLTQTHSHAISNRAWMTVEILPLLSA